MQYLRVNIPKDIDEYEKKVLFGITLRQLTWIIAAIVPSVGVVWLCTRLGAQDAGYLLGLFLTAAIFGIGGFRKWHGRPYSDFIQAIFKYYTTSQKLFYQKDITYKASAGKEDGHVQSRKDRAVNRKETKENSDL